MLTLNEKILKKILLEGNYVTAEVLEKAQQTAQSSKIPIVDFLLKEGIIRKQLLGQAIADQARVPYSDLEYDRPTKEKILLIPEEIAKKFSVVLFDIKPDEVVVATDNPFKKNLKETLSSLFPDKTITITFALPSDIEANFIFYQKSIATRFSKIMNEREHIAPEILDEIFSDALVYHASDIHFEPQPTEVVVRFRIDGVLHEVGRLPKEYYENIINRIKVQSRLRIDEHFAAQDGSLRYQKGDTMVDMRTSIVPTIEGEKIVLRVLASYLEGFTLTHLGLSPEYQELLQKAARKPFGMILVTGPTGSGKTTTLYAVLKLLNQPEVNITTIEDPVEYKVNGVNQIQVNQQTNLTFANGLRSIVRQDPNIILVGEIRDVETAEIAVNAALTGHLLISTFHANDAATAVPRLLDMKIEPFLLASTLQVIIAQRLVRNICEHCRHSVTLQKGDPRLFKYEQFFVQEKVTLFEGKKCETCNFTGYKGRTAIFEFIVMSPELQALVVQNPSAQQIWQLARSQGARSMFEDGLEKVKLGITTLEELLRVAEPPATLRPPTTGETNFFAK